MVSFELLLDTAFLKCQHRLVLQINLFALEMSVLHWQIELHEDESISILSVTLAWNDATLCAFEESIHSYELSICQVI